jgi:PST family polysaccharide transporter
MSGPAAAGAEAAGERGAARHSYRQILRSSTLVGAASLLQMLIGLVRTKAFAVWLGPAGLGLMSVLGTVVDLARNLASLGLNPSGVRRIAQAHASGDPARIVRTAQALRATAWVLGGIGAGVLVVASPWVSRLTFGTPDRAAEIALLGAALWLRLVADGYGALVHGLRRIGDMTRADLLAAAVGSLLAVGLVYAWREEGVAAALVAIAALSALTSWWVARQAMRGMTGAAPAAQAPPGEDRGEDRAAHRAALLAEARTLLRGGLALMGSGLLTLGAAWAVRGVLVRHAGLAEAGLFQSAWTLGGLLVGVVVQSMAADFYPRLVGVARDEAAAVRLVNEQMLVNLLVGGTGVLATMSLAPVALPLLYSRAFDGAQETLRWICLGMALRVVTWPMGTLLVAKGAQVRLLVADLVWALTWLGLAWIWVEEWGPAGAGMAFLAAYAVQAALLVPMVRAQAAMRWTPLNRRLGLAMAAMIGGVFACWQVLPERWAVGLGLAATAVAAGLALHVLRALVSPQALPPRLRGWLGAPAGKEQR